MPARVHCNIYTHTHTHTHRGTVLSFLCPAKAQGSSSKGFTPLQRETFHLTVSMHIQPGFTFQNHVPYVAFLEGRRLALNNYYCTQPQGLGELWCSCCVDQAQIATQIGRSPARPPGAREGEVGVGTQVCGSSGSVQLHCTVGNPRTGSGITAGPGPNLVSATDGLSTCGPVPPSVPASVPSWSWFTGLP